MQKYRSGTVKDSKTAISALDPGGFLEGEPQVYRAREYLPEGVKKMSRKGRIAILVFGVGLLLAIGPAMAMSVEPSLRQILDEMTTLQNEISQTREMSQEARDIAVTTRQDAGSFKEEVLARLGIWRGKLGQSLILALETRDLAERAIEEAKICTEVQGSVNRVNSRLGGFGRTMEELQAHVSEFTGSLEELRGEFNSLKGEFASHQRFALTAMDRLDEEIGGLESRVDREVAGLREEIGGLYSETDYLRGSLDELGADVSDLGAGMDELRVDIAGLGLETDELGADVAELGADVSDLGADISLAKEMAASAKIQADQARKETQRVAAESQKQTQILMGRVDKLIKRVEALEKGLGKPASIKLKVPGKKVSALKTYEVKRGETLAEISARESVYSNPDKWKEIFEANRDKISDPNSIYPGQILVIPQE